MQEMMNEVNLVHLPLLVLIENGYIFLIFQLI